MNIKSRPRKTLAGFLGRLLSVSLAVWALGVAYTPAQADVPVDQAPLIIQKPLPPNIVLMLDDSGSMDFDVMPDYGYLSSTSQEALINSGVNGVYYNPTITYKPPVKADGSDYPDADFSEALTNGFDTGSTKVNLSTYRGQYDLSRTGRFSDVQYSISVGNDGASSYDADSCSDYDGTSTKHDGYCYDTKDEGKTYDFYDPGNRDYYAYRCNSTGDAYKDDQCTPGHSFFTYTTVNSVGGYTRHYVAAGSKDCEDAGLSSSVCHEDDETRKNVANWFSYYHTRMLMAKSGLMNSFSDINETFRIGYGSLHGNNGGLLGARAVKDVKVFGDGASGTQKAEFWNWLVKEKPSGGTPLRVALKAVGNYYSTAQPWQTSESDTTELACRQSYTILTTDGFWNSTDPNVGNVDDNDISHTGPNSRSYTFTAAPPYSDDRSNTLADVAMKYWMTDLRPGLDNEVPTTTSGEDPAFWQHMVTFTLGLGFTPINISPASATTDKIFSWARGGDAIPGFSWPQPKSDSINNIADMLHAGVNGHGGFFSAKTPEAFASGLKEALKRAAERVGSGASLAANSTELKTGTVAYQANYYTGKWKGDLKALPLDPDTGAIAGTPAWSAVDQLPAAASRTIYTFNPDASTGSRFVVFKNVDAATPPALSNDEKTALGSDAGAQVKMVDYLRGDSTNEQKNGGDFRNRDTALGDIVDSQPVYVGAPDANQFYNESFTGSDTYATFASDHESRTALIYVAANDGMMHAFNATTGKEVFAYLPAAVITSDIKQLSDPDYGSIDLSHKYFNDGELTVADVYYGSAWHSVLVGTTGRGTARTVYAFDITDSADIKFLWERSAGDGETNSDYIGQMTGKPVIAQTSGGWSVFLGNGYNDSEGKAALLQFDIESGDLSVHKTDSTGDNGLAAPVLWIDDPTDGISTTAYAGDLQGRVWSFDLSKDNSTGTKLFTAMDTDDNVQPITAGMLAGKDPQTGNVWLFFGTGKYLTPDDLSDLKTQTWYGLIVQSPPDNTLVTNLSKGRDALVSRSFIAEIPAQAADPGDPDATPPIPPTKASLPKRVVTPSADADSIAGKSGWYIDLTSPTNGAEGERMVTPNQFQGNLLLSTSRIPQATDVCNPSGRGWINVVNPFTGTNPDLNFFDTNGDGQINSEDSVTVDGVSYPASSVGFSSLPNNPIFVGGSMLVSFDNGTNTHLDTSGSTSGMKRVSWRELINQ